MNTVVAYIPALHQGYINFFKKYPGKLFILGSNFISEHPRMDRDIRAIAPEEMKKIIESLSLVQTVSVLTNETLKNLKDTNIVMPDEDISRAFSEKYLPGSNIKFDTTFLRWDKCIPTKQQTPSPERIISKDEFDKKIMKEAFKEAGKSSDWWRHIGGMIVKDGKVVLAAHNRPLPSDHVHNIFGDPRSNFDAGVNIEISKFLHSEAALIAEAAKKGISLEGASLYVTTFPCPVCAKSICVSGVKKVYYSEGYSLLDAEDLFKTYGIELIQVEK
ncbi:hypothetical protein KW783_02320 [Candidatus Parcubacteria bacterium]|nr:hypothetical protein [Candidatus Parcubacteria bacterium]